MDDSEKFAIWLRRTAKAVIKAGLRRSKKLSTSDFIALGQLIVAVLMLFSLVQAYRVQVDTREALELTKRQLDSSIPPYLQFDQRDTNIVVVNAGSVEITNLEVIARARGQVRYDRYGNFSNDIDTAYIRPDPISYRFGHNLKPFESVSLDFTSPGLTQSLSDEKRWAYTNMVDNYGECDCLLIRYQRTSDRRPFLGFAYYSRIKNNSTNWRDAIQFVDKKDIRDEELANYPLTLFYTYPARKTNGIPLEISDEQKLRLRKAILNHFNLPEYEEKD